MNTPIGNVPENYPNLATLKKRAKIDCRLVTRKITINQQEKYRDDNGKTKTRIIKVPAQTVYKDWYILADEKPSPRTKKTASGNIKKDWAGATYATNEHLKFCAILDYVNWKAYWEIKNNGITGEVDRGNVLDVALGIVKDLELPDNKNVKSIDLGKDVERLWSLECKFVLEDLGKKGMKQYKDKCNVITDNVKKAQAAAETLPF